MQTVLFMTPMTLGAEVSVRKIHEEFPVQTLETAPGVDRITAFIGSGMYALQLAVNDEAGDFQSTFHGFLSLPEVQAFFDLLRPYIEGLPTQGAQTGELPLATPMLDWERGMAS